jgi:hypothetical protein
MPTPRRLNFNAVALSPNRQERGMIFSSLVTEALRLQDLNLNRYSPRNRSLATGFITAVINANRGNQNAMYSALHNLPRVSKIGASASPRRNAAATVIQSAFRGLKGRRAANWRLRQVNPRYAPVYMMNANGIVKVALPVIPKRK